MLGVFRAVRALCGLCVVRCLSRGRYAVIESMREGEVSAIQPFRYVRIVFVISIGVFWFGEVPDLTTLVGAAGIILSGLLVLLAT